VNYKANILKAYLENSDVADKINYIEEEKPLGTAGALKFLESKINSPFFVSNCDIIIKDDYTEIYKFHNEGNFDLTIVASLQYHKIPYGVCKIKEGGELTEITEKPEYNFLVNTGMYLLNPDVLKLIPENTFYNITDLIDSMKKSGRRVGVYPVSERSYLDVGQWGEYKNVLKILND
jgi:NDP-sugar pyrophosphorylase family protein